MGKNTMTFIRSGTDRNGRGKWGYGPKKRNQIRCGVLTKNPETTQKALGIKGNLHILSNRIL